VAQKIKGQRNFSGRSELKIKIKNYYTQTLFFRPARRFLLKLRRQGIRLRNGYLPSKQRPKATLGQIILKPSLKELKSKGKNPANEKQEKMSPLLS